MRQKAIQKYDKIIHHSNLIDEKAAEKYSNPEKQTEYIMLIAKLFEYES